MVRASSQRLASPATIDCHLFLGVICEPTATVNVYRGRDASDAAARLCQLAAGGQFTPNFPISTEDNAEGPAQKSAIHVVPGTAGVTVFYSE